MDIAVILPVCVACMLLMIGVCTQWDFFGLIRRNTRRYCDRCGRKYEPADTEYSTVPAETGRNVTKTCPACGNSVSYYEPF